jgi:RNA polymerase sigma-70 factor (ECF subfamily)
MATDGSRHSTGSEADEHGLVREVAEGSEAALASLYDRHADAVFSVALRLNRDRGVAEDIVQETFLALWNRAQQFDPSRGSLPAWLFAIARNRAIDRMRVASRRPPAATFSAFVGDDGDAASTAEWLVASGDIIGTGAAEPGPELVLAAKETRTAVLAALATLNSPERQAILLAYRDGLSQSEIAAHLGWPLGTVKTRSRRALRQLRDAIESAAAAESAGLNVSEVPSA